MNQSEPRFLPIPSLGNLYEINPSGVVRKVSTGKIIKPVLHDGKYPCIHFVFRGKWRRRCVAPLLREVFGADVAPVKYFEFVPIATTITKQGEKYSFPTLGQTAKFLAKREYYTVGTCVTYLGRRKPEMFGWQITYHEPEKRRPITASKANDDTYLRRMNKLEIHNR